MRDVTRLLLCMLIYGAGAVALSGCREREATTGAQRPIDDGPPSPERPPKDPPEKPPAIRHVGAKADVGWVPTDAESLDLAWKRFAVVEEGAVVDKEPNKGKGVSVYDVANPPKLRLRLRPTLNEEIKGDWLVRTAISAECCALSADGDWVAGAASVHVLDFGAGEKTQYGLHVRHLSAKEKSYEIAEAHKQPIVAVVFSPDAKRIASASADKTVKIWDAPTRTCRQTLDNPKFASGQRGARLLYSPDGERLACLNRENFDVTVWNLVTGKKLVDLTDIACVDLSFNHDGQRLATIDKKGVRVWDLAKGSPIFTAKEAEHKRTPHLVAYSPDGRLLAVALMGTGDGSDEIAFRPLVKVFDAKTWAEVYQLRLAENPTTPVCAVARLAFSADSGRVFAAVHGQVFRWNLSR